MGANRAVPREYEGQRTHHKLLEGLSRFTLVDRSGCFEEVIVDESGTCRTVGIGQTAISWSEAGAFLISPFWDPAIVGRLSIVPNAPTNTTNFQHF